MNNSAFPGSGPGPSSPMAGVGMEGRPAAGQVRGSEPARSGAWNAPLPPAPAAAAAAAVCGPPPPAPPRSLPSFDPLRLALLPFRFQSAPRPKGGRGSAGPLEMAREENGSRGGGSEERAGRAPRAQTRLHSLRKELGWRAWLAETRRSSRLPAGISCAWLLFRKMSFIRGVFF